MARESVDHIQCLRYNLILSGLMLSLVCFVALTVLLGVDYMSKRSKFFSLCVSPLKEESKFEND